MASHETELELGKAAVLSAFAGAGTEASQRAPDGGWSAWEVAYHLLDIERWYIAKLCEASAADRAEALARFVAVWARLRDEAIALARDVPAERLHVAGLLSGVPDWTPGGLIASMSAHDREHAAQVTSARARVATKPQMGAGVEETH